jgi:hypothetical protein
MASRHVEEAVEQYLTANWAQSVVIVENAQGEAPQDGSPFLRLQFPLSNTNRWPVNQRYYREEGAFRIVIAVERGSGTQKIREWGETLAALFRDREFNGIETQVPSEPFTDDLSDEGNYFVGSMIVPYTYNFTAA